MIQELFGSCPPSSEELEVCSGEAVANSNLITVDINPAKNPSFVFDDQDLPQEWNNRFDRWHCDQSRKYNIINHVNTTSSIT